MCDYFILLTTQINILTHASSSFFLKPLKVFSIKRHAKINIEKICNFIVVPFGLGFEDLRKGIFLLSNLLYPSFSTVPTADWGKFPKFGKKKHMKYVKELEQINKKKENDRYS